MPEAATGERSPERPVIVGQPGPSYLVQSPPGRPPKRRGRFTNEQQRLTRLDERFAQVEASFSEQVALTSSLPDADPHLVLVLVAAEMTVDLAAVARRLNFDVLIDADDSMEEDEEYSASTGDATQPFPSSLYAVATERSAFDAILSTWRTWRETQAVPRGRTPLRDLFGQLKDIRPWGPQDRLQFSNWNAALTQSLDTTVHPVEVELWFYGSQSNRSAAQQRVTAHLERDGGRVLRSAQVEAVGYHGLACELPTEVVLRLARGEYTDVQVVRSADVMFLKMGGQQVPAPDEDDGATPAASPEGPLPSGEPVVCLLDGVPVANHSYLADRVLVLDPDDLSAQAPVDQRRHGTAMVSVAVWGDLGDPQAAPAPRPVLIRPVMIPSPLGLQSSEEIPRTWLVPDLMVRVFRELFERNGANEVVAPRVVVVSLSIGDSATKFATLMSSWARTLDHLSEQYGVLVVVSAGNYSTLETPGIDARALRNLSGDDRRNAVMVAVQRQRINRSLLAPAEAINAVTVGALHTDASGVSPVGYQVDPADGSPSISPVTALGSGLRQSVKPEVAAPGGRVTYTQPMQGGTTLSFRDGTRLGPGIRVAAPSPAGEITHTVGTSPAAAMVARRAGLLYDLVDSLFPDVQLTRQQRAVAIKALLVHGTERPANLTSLPDLADLAIGHGDIARDMAGGCADHEATVLFIGALQAGEAQQLDFPLPNGLTARGVKRVSATLTWLSPTNWRHRQYRRAKLSFQTPAGSAMPDLGSATGLRINPSQRGATTVQHGMWETFKSFAGGQGDACSVLVTCREQAGGLGGEAIPYGVAVSLWTSPSLQVDVYSQVAQQIRAATAVRPPVR